MKNLLIVEDNDIDYGLLIPLVERCKGFSVDRARNVEEARAQKKKADVVILDLKLPFRHRGTLDQTAGLVVLEHIKDSYSEDSFPVVLMFSQFKKEDHDVAAYDLSKFPFVKGWFHKADDREALARCLSEIAFQK
jgi:CheY-like chemotaxis protein